MVDRSAGIKLLSTLFSTDDASILEEMVFQKYESDYKTVMMDIYASGFSAENVQKMLDEGSVKWKHQQFIDIVDAQSEIFAYIEKPFEVIEGMFTCPKCDSKRTVSFARQTRSSDEGMTTFIFCSNKECRHSWSCRG